MPALPIFTAWKETVGKGYTFQDFGRDALAGLIVSLIALPLAMALSIAVGLPPQHGLYTAIIAGIIAAITGGSSTQVSGPTAAFVVIVAPIVTQHGLQGLIVAQMMAGVLLVIAGWARLGRFIHQMPYPVTIGFTAGIAVVIATLSLNDLLGLGVEKLQGSYIEKATLLMSHMPLIYWPEALIGLVSMVFMIFGRRISLKCPSVMMGIGAGAALAMILTSMGFPIATIGNRFHYQTEAGMMSGIPPFPPMFELPEWPDWNTIITLILPAFVIAALAGLESLLSATVADSLTHHRHRHNPNSELTGIGLANISSGLFSGIPATGAIARTATNIKAGAKTPVAAVMHALFVLLYVLLLAPIIAYLPMASLAALLMITAYNMSHHRQFTGIIRAADRREIIVLVTCFALTVLVDMVVGVGSGIALSWLLLRKKSVI